VCCSSSPTLSPHARAVYAGFSGLTGWVGVSRRGGLNTYVAARAATCAAGWNRRCAPGWAPARCPRCCPAAERTGRARFTSSRCCSCFLVGGPAGRCGPGRVKEGGVNTYSDF
jgi:hypothetical protein